MQNTIKTTLLLLFCFTAFVIKAQEKKDLTIAAGIGWISTPDYYKSKVGTNYILDFDYQLTGKSALSTNFTFGKQRYQDTIYKMNSPTSYYMYGDSTNAEIRYYNFSVIYKYRLFNTKQFSASAGAGLSLAVVEHTRPIATANSYYLSSSSYLDLVFPIRLDLDYRFSTHFKAGIYGGTFIQPDYPFLGNNIGFRLGYTLH